MTEGSGVQHPAAPLVASHTSGHKGPIDMSGEEPVWLTPHLTDSQPEGESIETEPAVAGPLSL